MISVSLFTNCCSGTGACAPPWTHFSGRNEKDWTREKGKNQYQSQGKPLYSTCNCSSDYAFYIQRSSTKSRNDHTPWNMLLTPGNEKMAGKAPKPEGFSLISNGRWYPCPWYRSNWWVSSNILTLNASERRMNDMILKKHKDFTLHFVYKTSQRRLKLAFPESTFN